MCVCARARVCTCTRAHLYIDSSTRAQNNSRISARSEFPRCPQNALINILSNAPCVSRGDVKDGRRNAGTFLPFARETVVAERRDISRR